MNVKKSVLLFVIVAAMAIIALGFVQGGFQPTFVKNETSGYEASASEVQSEPQIAPPSVVVTPSVEQPTALATSSPTPEPPTVVETATTVPKTTTQKSTTTSSAKFSFTEYVELVGGKHEHGIILKNDGSNSITGVSLKWTENGNERNYAGMASITPGEQLKIPLPPYYLANDNPEKLGFIVSAR